MEEISFLLPQHPTLDSESLENKIREKELNSPKLMFSECSLYSSFLLWFTISSETIS